MSCRCTICVSTYVLKTFPSELRKGRRFSSCLCREESVGIVREYYHVGIFQLSKIELFLLSIPVFFSPPWQIWLCHEYPTSVHLEVHENLQTIFRVRQLPWITLQLYVICSVSICENVILIWTDTNSWIRNRVPSHSWAAKLWISGFAATRHDLEVREWIAPWTKYWSQRWRPTTRCPWVEVI